MADGRLDVAGVLRALRRRADLSQRELAARAGMAPSQLARLESGENGNPRLRTLERLVGSAAARIAAVDLDGTELTPLATDHWRDGAHRQFPPHLDTRPSTRWQGIYRRDMISFRRNRRHRDEFRRDCEGRRRYLLFTEFRLLGPRDLAILNLLRAEAADFDLAGRTPPALPPLDDGQALHYLRNPALRHWVAECGRRIFGYLVAHLHLGYAGPPTLVITALGIRPEHRAGLVGPYLAAAVCDEAELLGVGDIWALAQDPMTGGFQRDLGFRAAPDGCRLLAA